jgi:hypothetical protein
MTITELKQLRKKLTADPVGNKEQLLWIRGKIKSLQTIESNRRKQAGQKPRLSLYDSIDADKIWSKLYKEGKL